VGSFRSCYNNRTSLLLLLLLLLLQCVELKPDWAKGYSRLGAAYYGLQEWENAVKAYEDGEGSRKRL
jgi:hypothetical protein